MSNSKILNVIIIILAVIGVLAIILLVGMWLMHRTMMGGMMAIVEWPQSANGFGGAIFDLSCCFPHSHKTGL